jgi:hypothetical protein
VKPARTALGWALIVGIAASPCALLAQSGRTGEGPDLWWRVSVEAGGARLTCDLCDRRRDLGGALSVAFGAHASSSVRVGVEGGGWTRKEDGVRESVHEAGIVAEIHPWPERGLHLVGGLGWSGFRAGDFSLDAPRVRVGAGWDFPVTASWVVGNRVVLDAASFASLEGEGASVARSVGLSVVRFGVYARHR